MRPHRWHAAAACLAAACAALSGCGKQSILSDHSPQTHHIALLWWWMLGIATVVFLGAVVLLSIGWLRRRTAGLPFVGEREGIAQALVLLFGIGIPVVVLVALFWVADVYLIRQTAPPAAGRTAMTVEVIGHQWWWEVRYPSGGAVTANEIHIPVRTRVNLVATSADVIHSFWVPGLARKIDMVPGRQNRILLYASRPGTYRGQCAEFCGAEHAYMGVQVVAEPAAGFRGWIAGVTAPAASSRAAFVKAGQQEFMNGQCASCHQIRGTSARGTVGPDLTHIASRRTLAAVTIPNDPAHLATWISKPQSIKPGDRMPDLGLSKAQTAELVAYLESLR